MTHDPAHRAARLAEIRRQIEAGTYETPDKLSAALDTMLDRIADGRPLAEPSQTPERETAR